MGSSPHPLPGRYVVVFGMFITALLVLMDRACISVARGPITSDLRLTANQFGWVLSAFALGYALFQTPSGIWADRQGPRLVLASVIAIWSLFTALTGVAFGFLSLIFTRFLFGVGEAGAFPAIARAVFAWIPMKERGLVNGVIFSGGRIGAAFSLPLIAWMVGGWGWRPTFLALGLGGLLVAALWYAFFRDDPVHHPAISEAEKTYIQQNRQQQPAGPRTAIPLRVLLRSKNMWLAMSQYFCSNFTFFFCLTWLYPHLNERFKLESVEAGFWSSVPLLAGALGNWFSGWLVDRLYRKRSWKASRMAPAMTGFTLAVAGLLASLTMDHVTGAVVCLSLAVFGADMTLSPSWSLCVDIGQEHSGAVSGTMNMAGNLGSFVTALAFPYLNSWFHSTTPFFLVGALLNVMALVMWAFVRPEKRLEEY